MGIHYSRLAYASSLNTSEVNLFFFLSVFYLPYCRYDTEDGSSSRSGTVVDVQRLVGLVKTAVQFVQTKSSCLHPNSTAYAVVPMLNTLSNDETS
jgi:hypothetical protein